MGRSPLGKIHKMNKDIDENYIEDIVFDILTKHGIVDATTGNNEWHVLPSDNIIYDTETSLNPFTINNQKTFTLEHIINIIESMPIEMNIRHGGIFEYNKKELINKSELITKLKQL